MADKVIPEPERERRRLVALAQPEAKEGVNGKVKFQCPGCRAEGHDAHQDNAVCWPDGTFGCAVATDRVHWDAIAMVLGVHLSANGAGPQIASDAPAEEALRTYTWRELVQGERRTSAYHWPGWIPLATVALLVGAGETYKSWLALTLAVMTAAGRVLFARDDEGPLYQGSVLYLSAENRIEEEQRRCQLLQAALGLAEDLPITFVAAEA
jgi:AAA domain